MRLSRIGSSADTVNNGGRRLTDRQPEYLTTICSIAWELTFVKVFMVVALTTSCCDGLFNGNLVPTESNLNLIPPPNGRPPVAPPLSIPHNLRFFLALSDYFLKALYSTRAHTGELRFFLTYFYSTQDFC